MHWLLPDGVEEWLPPDSWRIEALRRRVLDVFAAHGFDLILPPVLEYTESLHSGVGRGLERKTFTLIDQVNGRQLGFRADITPQAARIDANRYARDAAAIRRLCYLGTVLRTHPDTPGGPRSLRQLGAEIFGHAGLAADVEVITLMCDVLEAAGVEAFTLDLGHVGILRAVLPEGLSTTARNDLLAAIQRKAPGEVTAIARSLQLDADTVEALSSVCELHGPAAQLQQCVGRIAAPMRPGLQELLELSQQLAQRFPGIPQHLDCGELSGFHYETGVTWAAYVPGCGQAIARGGRYDGIGSVFGADRPATGFSANLNQLLGDAEQEPEADSTVWAPAGNEPELLAAISSLRARGERVRQMLPQEQHGPGRALIRSGEQWILSENNS